MGRHRLAVAETAQELIVLSAHLPCPLGQAAVQSLALFQHVLPLIEAGSDGVENRGIFLCPISLSPLAEIVDGNKVVVGRHDSAALRLRSQFDDSIQPLLFAVISKSGLRATAGQI